MILRLDDVAVARGERVLIGRSAGWPEGMYSCLAGFIEPGETVEERDVLMHAVGHGR